MSDIFDVSLPAPEMLARLIAAKLGQPVSANGIELGTAEVSQSLRNTNLNCRFVDGTGRPPYRLRYDRYELDRLFPSAVRNVSVARVEIQEILYRLQVLYNLRFTADDFVIYETIELSPSNFAVTLRPVEGSLKFLGEVTFNCNVFLPG